MLGHEVIQKLKQFSPEEVFEIIMLAVNPSTVQLLDGLYDMIEENLEEIEQELSEILPESDE